MALISRLGIQLERHPHVRLRTEILEPEALTDNAHNLVRFAAQRDGLADHVRRGSEVTVPQSLTDEDDFGTLRRIFLRRKRSAPDDWRAEQLERVAAEPGRLHLLGNLAVGEIHDAGVERGGILDHL